MSDGGYKTMEKAFFEAQDEIDRLKNELKEAHAATDFANVACDRKDAQLATYKAAVVEAREALEAMTKPLYSNGAHSDEVLLEIRKRDSLYAKALYTLSALTGDATNHRM